MSNSRFAWVAVTCVFVVLGCGDSEPATEGSALLRTTPTFFVDRIASRVVCGSPEVLVHEGQLQVSGVDLDGLTVWAEFIEGLPPGDCTASLETVDPEGIPPCVGDAEFISSPEALAEPVIVMVCPEIEE